ncbi:MAG: phosphatidylglycerol lysyltransferase domain-containing protein [Streptococcaceae bacterium]|jgi:hypothetical protein|nr:phosphatidylglycerol lysyltransferase domain-containing protein [Streptococcaceae bacterium]
MKISSNLTLNLKKISISDKDWFSKLTYHVGISDLSFPLLYAYRNFLNVKCAHLDEKTALVAQDDAHGKRCYTILGDVNETIIKELTFLGINEFSYVIAAQLPIFKNIKGMKWNIRYDIDFSDYVYDLNKFLDFRGNLRKAYNSYKNHNQLNTKIVEINKNNWEESYKIFRNWWNSRKESSIFGNELKVFCEMEKFIESSKIEGALFYEEEIPVSFLMVEKRGEMLIEHFIKSNSSARGLTHFFYHQFFSKFKGEVKWINFEEDMGLPGLREFKRRFHPEFMLNKYTVRLDKGEYVKH